MGSAVAVQHANGKIVFGILDDVRADSLSMRAADKKGVSSSETILQQTAVRRVWRAELRSGGRQTGKGALIGLGASAAVGTGIFLGTRSQDDDGLAGVAILLAAIYGAGIGALAGFFHKTIAQEAGTDLSKM